MPTGISGIARYTFDLNSGHFLHGPFYPREETLPSRGVTSIRSSFLSRWSVTSHIYVRAIRIPAINSAEGQRIGFLRAVKVSERETKRENRRKTLKIRWKVRYFGERAPEFSGSGLPPPPSPLVFRTPPVFVTRRGQTENSIPFHESQEGREKVRLVSLRKGIRTMMTDTTVSIWGNFLRSPNATYVAAETNIGGRVKCSVHT